MVAGVWHGREGRIIVAGSDARFSFLNDMTWDVATRRLERTGSDPYGWIDLRASALPVRRVAMEFTGVIDQGVGSFSFFQSITNPTYVGLNSVDGTVTVQPGVVRVEAELNDSLCLRIDLPDFLLRPLELRRIVIERPFFNPGSWKFLTMVGAGLGAFGALAAMAVHTQVRRLGVGRVALLIFVFSAVLRIGLTAVNREAGDDHMKVCRILLDECRLPRTSDDWEGFQPKLYHATVAAIGYLLPPCRSTTGLLLTGQLLSCLAGLAFLGLVYRFLWQLPVSDRTRLWCFAFTAFNSKLISIHAQATNDSFVILFGALAIYAATRYLRTGTWRDWGWLIGALCLMALSKASGLVLVAVLPGVIALDLIWRIKLLAIDNVRVAATRMVGRLVVLGFFFAILVPIPGQYFQRYKESGTPFTTNVAVQPMPHWSKRTYVMRPGIISLHDGFLTFPLRSLLESPMITNHWGWNSDQVLFPGDQNPDPVRPNSYPLHMVSFWTQLYGGFYFAHFEHWPLTWQSTNPEIMALGRLLLAAGLLPCVIWLTGLLPVHGGKSAGSASEQPTLRAGHFLSAACVTAYLLFVAFYAVRVRDYSAMKAIFIFPAWLGIIAIFAQGLERARQFAPRPLLQGALDTGLGLVCLLGVFDIIYLIVQLAAVTPVA